MKDKEVDIRASIPIKIAFIIDKLVKKGYYSSRADFTRRSVIDKLINDFELGLKELEPDLFNTIKDKPKIKDKLS